MSTNSVRELEQQANIILSNVVDEKSPNNEDEEASITAEEEDDEVGSKKNPSIQLAGKEYDFDTAIVVFIIIFIWCVIWGITGLYKTLVRRDPIFMFIFITFILYMLINIGTSGRSSGGVVYELNILLTVEQMISILFGTVVLFTLFRKNLPVHENCQAVIFKLTMSIVAILTTASLWINVWTTGRAFRAVRKFKQGIYNVSLSLFLLIGLIYLKSTNC